MQRSRRVSIRGAWRRFVTDLQRNGKVMEGFALQRMGYERAVTAVLRKGIVPTGEDWRSDGAALRGGVKQMK